MDILLAFMLYATTSVRAEAYLVLLEYGREHEAQCLDEIYFAESSWNPEAVGDNGTSFGLPQRHGPANGYPETMPWPVRQQVEWTLEYADRRYGGVCEGAAFRRLNNWW